MFTLPSEWAGMFDIVSSFISFAGGPPVLIAKADSSRVGVIIGASSAGFVQIGAPSTAVSGFPVSNTLPPFMLTNRDYGPLTTQAFFFAGVAAGTLHLIEVFLRRPPPPTLQGQFQ